MCVCVCVNHIPHILATIFSVVLSIFNVPPVFSSHLSVI